MFKCSPPYLRCLIPLYLCACLEFMFLCMTHIKYISLFKTLTSITKKTASVIKFDLVEVVVCSVFFLND